MRKLAPYLRLLLTWQGLTLTILLINTIGMVGLKLVEPTATWLDCVLWTTMALWTFGLDMFEPTSLQSRVFQAFFLQFAFPVTVVVATLAIPPFMEFREAPRKGLAAVRLQWRKPLILIVNPVDWEKVRSLVAAITRRLGKVQLVVVSDQLDELPPDLLQSGLQLIRGDLRAADTYWRARLDKVVAVLVCAGSYQQTTADNDSAAIATLIERLRSTVWTTVEMVSRDNLFLLAGLHAADSYVLFDETTLGAACRQIKTVSGNRPVKLVYQVVDAAQENELQLQLKKAGLDVSETGEEIRLVLSPNNDDPKTDTAVWAQLKAAARDGVPAVGLPLSVQSKDLFAGYQVVIADQVMAEATVEQLIRYQQ